MPISINDLKTTFAGKYANAGNSLSDYRNIAFAEGGSSSSSGPISLGDFVGKTPASSGPTYTVSVLNDVYLLDGNMQMFTIGAYDQSSNYILINVQNGFTVQILPSDFSGHFDLVSQINTYDSIQINMDTTAYDSATVEISYAGDATFSAFDLTCTVTYSP
jgi:hypothetical protein